MATTEAGLDPSALLHLGVADQEAAWRLAFLARRLAALVARHAPAALFIHAYEGGHPDHDHPTPSPRMRPFACFARETGPRRRSSRCRSITPEQGALVPQAFAPEPAVGSIVVELKIPRLRCQGGDVRPPSLAKAGARAIPNEGRTVPASP